MKKFFEKRYQKEKGFTLIEVIIVTAIIAILVAIILVNVSLQRQRAEFAAFQSYVADVSGLAQAATTAGLFDNFTANELGCLGDYSANGHTCWGSSSYNNANPQINQALQSLGSLPPGEISPASGSNDRGVAIRVDGRPSFRVVRIFAWTGPNNLNKCDEFGWDGAITTFANSCYVEFNF